MPKEATMYTKERSHSLNGVPTDLDHEGVAEICAGLRRLLADVFVL